MPTLLTRGFLSAIGLAVLNNRVARCLSTEPDHEYPGPRGTKCGYGKLTPFNEGADSNGFFPEGGYFGIATEYFTGPSQEWSGNFWDDDLEPVEE